MAGEEEKIVLILVIAVVAAVTIYMELRIRKMGLRKKVSSSRVKKDQAFNSLHTTKAVRNKLRIDRVDTMKADYMISKAETAYDDGDFEDCANACRRAREELLRCKREGIVVPEAPSNPAAAAASARQSEGVRTAAAGVDNPAQLQAKFELKAAKTDLEAFVGDVGIRNRAAQLIADADRQLNANDFQKSLSASFRARKLMSGETLEDKPAKEPAQPEKPKEAKAEGSCASCGAPLEPDDIFCHSCGKSVRASKCAYCGADLKGNEKFCRKCGKAV
jgi:hypothetical protein